MIMKRAKEALGYTIEQMAHLLGCVPQTFKAMLKDDDLVRVDHLIILHHELERRRLELPIEFMMKSDDGKVSTYTLGQFVEYLMEDLPAGPELTPADTGNTTVH